MKLDGARKGIQSRIMAVSMTMNFRMQAAIATFFPYP
jgi:hypothetical protein